MRSTPSLRLGWRGNPRQWKLQTVGGILLSALMLPIFVSVHSIVSWDFAVTPAVEGWHSTIFAPYFVIGAVHSGVSAVVTMMALMRWLWKWEDFIRPEHFDALARLLIVVATGWLAFTFLELIFAVYGLDAPELALRDTPDLPVAMEPAIRHLRLHRLHNPGWDVVAEERAVTTSP